MCTEAVLRTIDRAKRIKVDALLGEIDIPALAFGINSKEFSVVGREPSTSPTG
jgi:hypothetical protein